MSHLRNTEEVLEAAPLLFFVAPKRLMYALDIIKAFHVVCDIVFAHLSVIVVVVLMVINDSLRSLSQLPRFRVDLLELLKRSQVFFLQAFRRKEAMVSIRLLRVQP